MASHADQPSEVNFDGLVGPTHNYAGLARGNLASIDHGGKLSNPRAAAQQGLDKMWHMAKLGLAQGVLPPHARPDLEMLRQFGFCGSDAEVLAWASRDAPRLLAQCSSASSMWTANAATVVAGCDSADQRTHFIPANLASLLHRQLEVSTTSRVLRAIFQDRERFLVHDALPSLAEYGDEGAANHTRLWSRKGALHMFAWGHDPDSKRSGPKVHPARQSLLASKAVARLARLGPAQTVFVQQNPLGIDAGAFHTDVLAVGNDNLLLMHERAFVDGEALVERLQSGLGDELVVVVCSDQELPVGDAIEAYPFNSQLVTQATGGMLIVAPLESAQSSAARRFLERVVDEDNPVERVEYLDVRESMANGGGPACLRLRVPLLLSDRSRLGGRVMLDENLYSELTEWVSRHYRDRLSPDDLADPSLLDETRTALHELTQILQLGSLYDFQRGAG